MGTFNVVAGITTLASTGSHMADSMIVTKAPVLSGLLPHLRHRLAIRLWRMKFFAAYLLAVLCYRSAGSSLLFFTERAFAHTWVTRVTLEFRPVPPTADDQFPIDAPVVLSVWRDENRALVMAGHFLGGCWYVKQLQGAAGTNIPKELDWTVRFLTGCQAFARAGGCTQVRLVRASDLIRFVKPERTIREKETVEQARARILKKLLFHYDKTGERLGFVPEGRWTVWRPNSSS